MKWKLFDDDNDDRNHFIVTQSMWMQFVLVRGGDGP